MTALAPMEAEFAGPQWVFGLSDYGIDADGTVVASSFAMGDMRLWAVAPGAAPRDLGVSADEIDYLRVRDGVVTLIGGFATRPRALMTLDLRSGREERLRESEQPDRRSRLPLRAAAHRVPDLRRPHGLRLVLPAHQPRRCRARGTRRRRSWSCRTAGRRARRASALSLERQAFTSRGFAVVDVDYGGSTGYGRRFRDQLRERWGIVDVDDCTNVALWLAEQGLADRRRLAIRGGSAGGYTTLASLCFRDVFTAGTSFYGLGDLEAFAEITHKFESRYMDILVGPYPEQAERYRERSPDRHADRISCPVLVMQGADDKIVPPSQAEGIVAALARNGLPHAYLLFEGEGHGFRQAANRRRALEAELSFYAQVFGFELAGDIEPLADRRSSAGALIAVPPTSIDRRAGARRSIGAGRGGGRIRRQRAPGRQGPR